MGGREGWGAWFWGLGGEVDEGGSGGGQGSGD